MTIDKDFAVRFFRSLPTMVLTTMLGHVLLLCFGINTVFAEIVEVSLGFVAVYMISVLFKYCFLHRIQILFAYFITACCWWQKYTPWGFANIREEMHIIVLTIGMLIMCAVVSKMADLNTCDDDREGGV